MLGDAGANALGAMLGVAAVISLGRPARAGVLAGIVALTAASEKVSFTKVIARTPALNWLDMLGRVSPGNTNQSPGPPAAADARPSIRLLARWGSLRRAGSLSVLSGDKRRSPGQALRG